MEDLKAHPEQATLVHDLSEEERASLAESMQSEGLREPVEILPNGILLSGHQRVLAARQLGWKKIAALVRNDLADQPAEALRRLIEANRHRQRSRLDQVRMEVRLLRLTHPKILRWQAINHLSQLTSSGSSKFSMPTSKKHLGRLYDISQATLPLQRAVDERRIPIVNAAELSKQPKEIQVQIVSDLAAGKPKQTLLNHFAPQGKKPSPIKDALLRTAWRLQTRLDPAVQQDRTRSLTYADGLQFLKELAELESSKLKHPVQAKKYIAQLVIQAKKA